MARKGSCASLTCSNRNIIWIWLLPCSPTWSRKSWFWVCFLCFVSYVVHFVFCFRLCRGLVSFPYCLSRLTFFPLAYLFVSKHLGLWKKFFAEWWLPAPMFAVADGQLQGKQELIHNGFSYLRIFKEVSNVLHFLQGEAVSLGVTFVFWCFL